MGKKIAAGADSLSREPGTLHGDLCQEYLEQVQAKTLNASIKVTDVLPKELPGISQGCGLLFYEVQSGKHLAGRLYYFSTPLGLLLETKVPYVLLALHCAVMWLLCRIWGWEQHVFGQAPTLVCSSNRYCNYSAVSAEIRVP